MTVIETLLVLQTLLDDRSLAYFTFKNAVEAINQAQMMRIQQGIAAGEERMLRPLYAISNDYDAPSSCPMPLPANYHHARTLDIYLYDSGAKPFPIGTARYIRPGEFLSLSNRDTSRYSSSKVITNYSWTIMQQHVYWSRPSGYEKAILTYIRKPAYFSVIRNDNTRQPLELPAEYHIEVATIAAELLNDIDTLEQEREQLSQEGTIQEPK